MQEQWDGKGYFSNLIKQEERPVTPSLQAGVGCQRLDHLCSVGKCLVIGNEHNTRALRDIPPLMSPSQPAHAEHAHRRRQVLSTADSLISEKHLGVPPGKSSFSDQWPRKDYSISLKELLQMRLRVCNSGWFSLQETIQCSFMSNLHPHTSYIIHKDEREHYLKLVFRSSVISKACCILFGLRSQQKEHTSHIILRAWSLNTGLEAHKVTVACKCGVIFCMN